MSNWAFVAAAYGLTWLVLAMYALHVNRRVRRASAALALLEADSFRDDATQPAPGPTVTAGGLESSASDGEEAVPR